MSAIEYYNSTGNPSTGASGASSVMRAEFDAVEAGFGKLPDLSGNGSKAVFINSGGTAMEAVTAANARTALGLVIGTDVQAYDADTAKLDVEDQALTGGVVVTSKSLGTISSGTVTPDPGDRPLQHYTNGGAHTLGVSANNGSVLVDITNNGSAGAITTSGFTKVSGDSFTTTNGHKFRCHISIGNAGSLLNVQAMQ